MTTIDDNRMPGYWNERLSRAIPGGAHTYSKGSDQYPSTAPEILVRGEGSYVWDPLGNRFLDYGMGLRSVTLGYAYQPVVDAAYEAMKKGNNLSRPSTIELDAAERRRRIQDALIAKHFSLWDDLKTPANLDRIRSAMDTRIAKAGVPEVPVEADYGVYELFEFQERQAKFVVSGQRVYEYFGCDWRLPLWDAAYVDFFERMPLSAKIGQSLYREVLEAADWGGVWHPMFSERYVTPRWARYARIGVAAPLKLLAGEETWKRVDRRLFTHPTDTLCIAHAVPWSRALLDRRGFRHGLSFRGEDYLRRHGLSPSGVAAAPVGAS